jgi:hypothetical protein
MDYSDNAPLLSSDAIIILVAFIICVDCAKEPEYRCENCNKVYKQESRYNTHIATCIDADPREVSSVAAAATVATVASASDFSELLRQNREMMDLMRQQQETIQLLVAKLIPRGGGGGGGGGGYRNEMDTGMKWIQE